MEENKTEQEIPAAEEMLPAEEAPAAGKRRRFFSPPEKNAQKAHLPLGCKIIFCLIALAAVIEVICLCSEGFADFFNIHIARYTRIALCWLTAWIPFSLGELLVFLIPLILVLILTFAYRKYSDSWHDVGIFCLIMLSVIGVFFVCYVFTLGTGYAAPTIDRKLELDRKDVSAEELTFTTDIVVEEIRKITPDIRYGADGFSVMPYGYAEMVSRLLDAYDTVEEKYSFIRNFRGPVKTVMHSEPWTYTHITGVYSYFTGEANINTNMPDYTVPFTAAHELAHQRGIAREDEANFVAFLVCIASDDEYIRYSGYLNMFEYLAGPLNSADRDSYVQRFSALPTEVRKEEYAYSDFFSKYRKTVVSEVSEAINDTYLKINGTAGTKSYGMVVDLAVAYYKN